MRPMMSTQPSSGRSKSPLSTRIHGWLTCSSWLDLLDDEGHTAATDPDSNAWTGMHSLSRAEVSQATGMLMAQLSVGPAEALVRLRAHAFAIAPPPPRSPAPSSIGDCDSAPTDERCSQHGGSGAIGTDWTRCCYRDTARPSLDEIALDVAPFATYARDTKHGKSEAPTFEDAVRQHS